MSAHDAGVLAEILNEAHASSKSLSEIRELIEKALDPNRTTVTFMPDGESMTKNETAGSTMVMDKGERDVFEQFIALESAKNWTALLSLVQSEENKVPTWFTVDYFSSEAYFHTCRLDKAVESLNKFIAEVRHVGNYAEMFKHSQEILLDLESRGEAMRRNCADHGAPTQQ